MKLFKRQRGSASDGPGLPPLELPRFTHMNAGRFLYFKRLFDRVSGLEGDVVECGVGYGVTLLYCAFLCVDVGRGRRVWGFDTFQGFPAPTAEDDSPRGLKQGELFVSTAQTITDMFGSAGLASEWIRAKLTLVEGYFEDTLPKYTGDGIALLHIDADLYESYRTSLHLLYDRVVPGGVIAFDEYMGTFEHINFPGARKAIDEFFDTRAVRIERDPAFGKYFAVKPPAAD